MSRPPVLPLAIRPVVAQMIIGGVQAKVLAEVLGVQRGTVMYCANLFGPTLLFRRDEFRSRFQGKTPSQLKAILEKAELATQTERAKRPRLFQMDGMPPVEVTGRTKYKVTYRRQNGTIGTVDRETFNSLYAPVEANH